MQHNEPRDSVPDTNVDLLNENRGVEPTRDEEDLEERDDKPAEHDAVVATAPSAGMPMGVVVGAVDGDTTAAQGDQAEDARLERERGR